MTIGLMNSEKNIILFHDGEGVASVYICNSIMRLLVFSQKRPDLYQLEKTEHLGDVCNRLNK